MADPPVKSKGGGLTAKKGPLPVWAWAAIALVGLYFGYRWYQNRSASAATATPAASTSGTTTATNPTDSTTGSSNTAGTGPDTSGIDAAILALLGGQAGEITGLGQNLADVATTAENQLGYLAQETTVGSFQLAQQSITSNTSLAQSALFANQPTTAPSQPNTVPVSTSNGGAPAVYATTPTTSNPASTFNPSPGEIGSAFFASGSTPQPSDAWSHVLGGNTPTISTSTDVAHPNANTPSGAGAVKSGSSKTNTQAKARAF